MVQSGNNGDLRGNLDFETNYPIIAERGKMDENGNILMNTRTIKGVQ